jgi:hypothetical protein
LKQLFLKATASRVIIATSCADIFGAGRVLASRAGRRRKVTVPKAKGVAYDLDKCKAVATQELGGLPKIAPTVSVARERMPLMNGVRLAFGTDYPVEPLSPFRGLYAW